MPPRFLCDLCFARPDIGGPCPTCAPVGGRPHRSLPDWIVHALGPLADDARRVEAAGGDPYPLALAAVRRKLATYEGGDRAPSPPVVLLRAVEELSRPAGTGNPPPKPSMSAPVWSSVIDRLDSLWLGDRLAGLVRSEMEARHNLGVARYGTPLQADNGRDHLRDQLEEALDGAAYAMAEALKRQAAGDHGGMLRNLRRCDVFVGLAAELVGEMALAGGA